MHRALTLTPIVNEQRFIIATRDTGYRSTGAAIAELVDNAIQAQATNIQIFVEQRGSGSEREVSVGVLDNGCGMDAKTLSIAMQFAGSNRFNDRSGLGRFGMGLPNSSVSQARRVDVYTWQQRGRVLHSCLDVDQISAGEMRHVPKPKWSQLPGWAEKYVRKQSGTLIWWSRCDRLDNRKASTIVEKLIRPLGQRFRHYLWGGNHIRINGVPLLGFDPLYLRMENKIPAARPFGDTLTFEFRRPDNPQLTSTVRVRFSELPISQWYELPSEKKRELGVPKGAGISIMRSNREIDFGWYFLGGKRKENYDDWWRGEICFDPELDELFGVTHSKQEINPTDLMRAELCPHLEAIAQTLNSRARAAFLLVRNQEDRKPSPAEARASERESALPPMPIAKPTTYSRGQKHVVKSLASKNTKLTYKIISRPLQMPDAFVWDADKAGIISITVNENHAFFDQVFSRLNEKTDGPGRHGIECLLLAFSRAALAVENNMKELVTDFRRSFSNILAAYLGD